ncbi:zinc-ribbon domain-containing protein [Enterococcus pallens]|uniref:Zinc-ribbon domain-containing protein n=1 Tax=Enterococcus pallens ATCC BAA-351 TaxID=1158607 RepID=R2TBE9_9ENTE|nr:zinc-ribbon domain-containing protein [Enterococcus pallens]EOH97529.1 hypothetical protein UAU_00197 [Enterococcus pallens ATCC BAA-351]EOU21052.1 hypothetical protein I588_01899 [Enterococcus pallens ATCC BAA-351]OJG77813.1 hypothetical protein RV10_GL002206 [Enterococcus pallens]
MKYCPNCGAANQKDAAFCEQCGHKFASETEENITTNNDNQTEETDHLQTVRNATRTHQNSKTPLIIGIVVLLGIVVGAGIFFASYRNNPEPAASRTTSLASRESSSEQSSETSETVDDDLSKYDEIIQEAKELTINGEFKESSLKLASIPVSDLSKSEFRVIRDAVQDLTQQNNIGIQEEKSEEMKQSNNANPGSVSTGGFVDDFAKWANTYTFYYSQSGQKHSSLTIAANGGVTQNNYDGTQYFGKASISSASGSVLSYETNELYPSSMPNTKSIRPDVQIHVKWDTGGSQTFYGYLSYSSRLALTDGVNKGAGVNEVWISY